MAKKKRRGRGGIGGGILVFFLVLSCIFAWLKTPTPIDTNNPMEFFEAKSKSVQAWAEQIEKEGLPALLKGVNLDALGSGGAPGGFGGSGGGSGGGGSTPEQLKTEAKGASTTLNSIKVADAESINYDRDEWNHWVTAPGAKSCWNVREEVLYRDSDKSALVLKDSSGNTTADKSKACSVASGKWTDPYSGNVITDPRSIDIDHMIPLSYAAQHGGQGWNSGKKEDYANNLSDPRHLVASSATENRTKGDKGPSRYQPKTGHCQYAVDWIGISSKWNLTVAPADKSSLEKMLATC